MEKQPYRIWTRTCYNNNITITFLFTLFSFLNFARSDWLSVSSVSDWLSVYQYRELGKPFLAWRSKNARCDWLRGVFAWQDTTVMCRSVVLVMFMMSSCWIGRCVHVVGKNFLRLVRISLLIIADHSEFCVFSQKSYFIKAVENFFPVFAQPDINTRGVGRILDSYNPRLRLGFA